VGGRGGSARRRGGVREDEKRTRLLEEIDAWTVDIARKLPYLEIS